MGDETFDTISKLSEEFIFQLQKTLKTMKEDDLVQYIQSYSIPDSYSKLGAFITDFVNQSNRQVVLMIDEVDKASNHILFLNFLGMLRNKYLNREAGKDQTFHSVALAGLHDVKNIKKKMLLDSGEGQPSIPTYNSPWNIATEFKIDLSFNPQEIETMLVDYIKDNLPTVGTQVSGIY